MSGDGWNCAAHEGRLVRVCVWVGGSGRDEYEQTERTTTNRITPAGEQVVAEIKAVTDALRVDILKGIDAGELETCRRVLSRIIARLDELD